MMYISIGAMLSNNLHEGVGMLRGLPQGYGNGYIPHTAYVAPGPRDPYGYISQS